MHEQTLINIAYAAVMSLSGWFGKTLWDAVRELQRDIQRIEVDLPKNYVRRVDIEARFDKLDAILNKIFDKLDEKVDK